MTKGNKYQIDYTDPGHPCTSYHGEATYIESIGEEHFFKIADGSIACFYDMDIT